MRLIRKFVCECRKKKRCGKRIPVEEYDKLFENDEYLSGTANIVLIGHYPNGTKILKKTKHLALVL